MNVIYLLLQISISGGVLILIGKVFPLIYDFIYKNK